jgi:hypothetical protein
MLNHLPLEEVPREPHGFRKIESLARKDIQVDSLQEVQGMNGNVAGLNELNPRGAYQVGFSLFFFRKGVEIIPPRNPARLHVDGFAEIHKKFPEMLSSEELLITIMQI